MSDEKAGAILNAVAGFTAALAPIVGGATGAGLAGASSIAKVLGQALASRRESVATILARFVAPPDVKLKWEPDPLIDTVPHTPGAIAAAKKDGG